MSDMDEVVSASGCPIAGTCCAKPTMHFRGRRILAASIKQLATLGLSGATEVLITGVGWGGTAAILNADFLAEQIKAVAPVAARIKVMPVDGIHPKDPPGPSAASVNMQGIPKPWMSKALQNLDALSNVSKVGADPACLKSNIADTSVCLEPTVALSYVKTPLFAVQEFPSVWDAQCLFDGVPNAGILQVGCSDHNAMYDCAQYSDLCPKDLIQNFFVPVQKQYVAQTTAAGLATRAGSGGFLHGCYIGAYFYGVTAKNYTECYPPPCNGTRVVKPPTGIWQQIEVGGVSMLAAISKWWSGSATDPAVWHVDTYWDPNGVPPNSTHAASFAAESVESRRRLSSEEKMYLYPQRWEVWMRPKRRVVGRRRGPPPVPWYVSRYMTNPTCRGFPWYSDDEAAEPLARHLDRGSPVRCNKGEKCSNGEPCPASGLCPSSVHVARTGPR